MYTARAPQVVVYAVSCVGEGQWVFADGVSFFRGTYKAGQRVEGQLVMYGSNGSNGSNSNTPQAGDSANAKQLVPVHTYTGR